jgi:hypothetical protein
MKRSLLFAFALAFALTIATTQSVSAFEKYAGQSLHIATGVFINFGNGNRQGGVTIKSADGVHVYATSLKTTFNGKATSCVSDLGCATWPANIIPKKTRVRVTWWTIPMVAAADRAVKDVSVIR